ncbi:hypothetical protein AGMMS50229_12430 [Campylobacterota bacterium]|nr:hypothetical protein AGMMS50229_12430 [Campylobacterota bacterium]
MRAKIGVIVDVLYIILLGLLLGSALTLGALTAPVVFTANLYLPDATLSVYQTGALMSEIFRRYAFVLTISLALIVIYETHSFIIATRKLLLISVLLVVVSGALFASYYTPVILELQKGGLEAIATERFSSIHNGAEAVFKLFSLALTVQLVLRILRLMKHY